MSELFDLAGETLSGLGSLRWIRVSGGRHSTYEYHQVPFLGWRFEEPSAEKLRRIERAVATTPTQVDWRIDTSRRNWLLAPARILGDGENAAASPAFDDRVKSAMQDQDFCVRAWADLGAMLRTLRELRPALKMTFTVRSGQGEPSAFDLGDMMCEGECGAVRSAGHVPDQGMMIYLSVPLLLDSLRPLFTGERKVVSFVGADTSFRLDFRRDRKGTVSVSAQGAAVGTCGLEELADAVLRPAQELAEKVLSVLPEGDGARGDFVASMERFRASTT
ncbi:hypothetical protein R1T08_22495 [Streptomyces sp. SBC-4]|nr:hypothetical protein [Streptomyces sp. SBC-4]MDV5146883.1 hypothetical protein [Streptomyces sp. SBC-4]